MTVAVATVAAYALPLFFTASLALDIGRELDMTVAGLGVAITIFWIVATLSSFPAGRLVDRIGPVASGRLAGALVVLGSLGIAAAARSFAAFTALLAVTAIGNAIIPPAMSALVTGELKTRRRGAVLGLQQAGPPLASVVAGLALPTLSGMLGWRGIFALGAVAAALATVGVRGAPGEAKVTPAPAVSEERRAFALLLALGGLFASGAATGLVSYLVLYASDAGMSASAAGVLLAVASVVCVATRIELGVRRDRRRAPLLPQMAALVFVGTLGFALLAVGTAATVVAGAVLAVGIGWGWPGLYLLAAVEHGPAAPGRSVGTAVTGTFAGAIMGPSLVAFLATASSFEVAWAVCAALSVVGGTAFLVAGRFETPLRPATAR